MGIVSDIIDKLLTRPTHESAEKIREYWQERLKMQALFSARTTCEAYLDEVKARLKDVADRKQIPLVGKKRMAEALGRLGYTPESGFPGDPVPSVIPLSSPGRMTDLSSERRLQLVVDTNIKQARSMQQLASSEDPIFKMTNPAWRLTRTGARKKPRQDWLDRWKAAGDSVGWQGALPGEDFVALKDSPIWGALGNGVGGFRDTLGSPYPPFAFGSGMAWVNVGRRECKRLGLDVSGATPSPAELRGAGVV